MPDNRMGDEHEISIPSRTPIANDPSFKVLRTLDGHIVPDCETTMLNTDLSNPHEIGG